MDLDTAHRVLLLAYRSGDERTIEDARRRLAKTIRRIAAEQAAAKLAGFM